MEITKSIRRRVNITRTVTNKISWDATVDMENFTLEEVLAESDKLIKALEERYPIALEARKE